MLNNVMKKKYRTVPTRFQPETRFALRPTPVAPFRAIQTSELERLKNRLTVQLMRGAARPELHVLYRRAANDAAALAWATPFPLLVFPTLLEERAALARCQLERQKSVWRRSLP